LRIHLGEQAVQTTIFWEYRSVASSYTQEARSLADAASAALDELADDLAEDGAEEPDVAIIRDDLKIEVWAGIHKTRPAGEPDYTLT
jgi:hypothetical protein